MSVHEVKWVNGRSLILYENNIEQGRLIYPKFSLKDFGTLTLIIAGGNNYEIKFKPFLGTVIKSEGKDYVKITWSWNWMTEVDVSIDMEKYTSKFKLKYRFWFPRTATLMNEKNEPLLKMIAHFNWRRFRWDYELDYKELMPSGEVGNLLAMTSLYYFRQIIYIG